MHCTDMIPPTAHASLCNHSLMLHLQVMPFTQQHFNLGLLVCGLDHYQQFRQHLFEPAAIHTQQCSQNLAENTLPSFYCDDIFVLIIVLYCITIATVSHLIHPVTGTTSHKIHHAMWLSSQVACLYSSLISHSTSLLMCTQFYLQMTMSCGSWWNHHVAHTWHRVLYSITVLTVQKASNSFPSQLQVWEPLSENFDKFRPLQSTHLTLHTPPTTLCTSLCTTQFSLHSLFTPLTL